MIFAPVFAFGFAAGAALAAFFGAIVGVVVVSYGLCCSRVSEAYDGVVFTICAIQLALGTALIDGLE